MIFSDVVDLKEYLFFVLELSIFDWIWKYSLGPVFFILLNFKSQLKTNF